MHRGSPGFILRFIASFVLIFTTLFTYSQPPTTNPGGIPTIPSTITPPVNMTNPQLQTLLSDQNKGAGEDMNAKLQNNKIVKDSLTQNAGINQAYSPKNTYGANVFANAAQYSITELSTPPLDYPLGVGDNVVVSMYGGAEFQGTYLVGTDGSIFPKGMGKIYVGGVQFQNVQRMLYARFAAVVPAGTNIDISLGQPRSININVVNEVRNPGIKIGRAHV